MRFTSINFSKSLPDWFVFSLPDGLWLFSYISVVLLVWKNQITKHSIAWILIIPLYAIVHELGQLFKFTEGTFAFNDLLFYSIAIFLPFILYKNLLTFKF